MDFHRITNSGDSFHTAAATLYRTSFPINEQRFPEDHADALSDPAFHCEAILDNSAFAGLIFYWQMREFCYVEHFAVAGELRGRRVGSRALAEFCKRHGRVILEIDPVCDEITTRRKRFYQHLGFRSNPQDHRHPPYRGAFPPHRLEVLSYPNPLTEDEYNEFFQTLCVLPMRYSEPSRIAE